VLEAQGRIRTASLIVFLIACSVIFLAVFFLSDTITRPLRVITNAAYMLENDERVDPETLAPLTRGSDELSQLARVFRKMVEQVQTRQQQLKQEVARLQIQIDESKRQQQVSEIVDTEFFQDLKNKARSMRKKDSGKTDGSMQ
jgi:nitrate/nitrite-specific signal transduction histidine kinase